MRLIDAEAAKSEVYECDEPMTHKDVCKLLREQPAVSCEECRFATAWVTPTGDEIPLGGCYAAVGQANGDDGELSPNPTGFGCAYFERRQRTGQEADDAAAGAWFGGEPR